MLSQDLILSRFFSNDPQNNLIRNLKRLLPEASIHLFPVFQHAGEQVHMALYMARSLQKAGFPMDAHKAFNDSFLTPLLASKGITKKKVWYSFTSWIRFKKEKLFARFLDKTHKIYSPILSEYFGKHDSASGACRRRLPVIFS